MLKPGKYDVYILGDLDRDAFDPGELKQLAETVNQGKGLIVLGGFHSFGPGGYSETELADVLPIKMERWDRQPWNDKLRDDMHLNGQVRMTPTLRQSQHFVMTLAAGAVANAEAWKKLPPLDGANRFEESKLKPDAVVLADADGNHEHPLLVARSYGAGRVVAFAGDSTWRWWLHGFESAHKRFWRQIVLWLAHKDQEQEGNVWVRLDNTRFFPGNRVEFTAGADTPQNEPVPDAQFKAEIIKPDGKLRARGNGRQGRPAGRLLPRHAAAGRLHDRGYRQPQRRVAGSTRASAVHRRRTGPGAGQRLVRSRRHERRRHGLRRQNGPRRNVAEVAR